MKREFCRDTLDVVRGSSLKYRRQPLHIDFSPLSNRIPGRRLERYKELTPEGFNAVGSLIMDSSTELHLPVIDVDGGVTVENKPTARMSRGASKAILRACYKGEYIPGSNLRDVLGDYGIDVEVFQSPILGSSTWDDRNYYEGMQVSAVVLRANESGIFEGVGSTTEGHGHLYMQQEFGAEDHKTLIQELGNVGIISPDWQHLVNADGMGIVRTPWTDKDIRHKPS